MKRISDKKKQQYIDEIPVRKALCERCGGTWIPAEIGDGGVCAGGHCEVCGSPPLPPEYLLRPHEKKFKSQGGKLSMENSVMACKRCQSEPHSIKVVSSEPIWSKE